MKKPILFTFLLASTMANAQLTQANEPAIAEISNMFLCDSFTVNLDGVTGSAVTWDYSAVYGYPGETRSVEVVSPASTTYGSNYPSATKAFEVENAMITYFSSSTTERVSQGFFFTEASFGDVVATFENDDQTMATYPFAVGNSVVDNYDGTVEFNFNGIPVSESIVGNAYAWIDGGGTLLLPNAVSVPNVIRYKSIDTAFTSVPIAGPVELIRTQYEYYDHASQNLPIFIHSTVTIGSPGGAPLATVSMVLSKFEANYASIEDIETIDFTVYPNPAADIITVKGEFTSLATGSIVDQSGRVLKTMNVQNGQTINMADLANGIYLFTIEDNGFATTKTIIKK